MRKLRNFLWRVLGVGYDHISAVADCRFLKEDKLTTMGEGSYNNHALVYRWGEAPLIIGKYCSISYGVKFIMDYGGHKIDKVTSYPFEKDYSVYKDGISVGNDVWIGMDVIILPGVTIGNGVTIAAGSVVTKDVPDYSVVAGTPAKIVKTKCSEEEVAAMNRIAWWNWGRETIKDRKEDFGLDIPNFIAKYSEK